MPEPDIYTIGWICAIQTELVAAAAFLDERHDDPDTLAANDDNAYVLGRIGKHNVVIAALPHGQYGLVSAASVARDLVRSFPNVRIGLMVGIGGGAPSQKHDIRLGDVVVGTPGNSKGGVLQYDYGKVLQGEEFVLTGHLIQPSQGLLTALTTLWAQYERDGHDIQAQIDGLLEKKPRLRAKYSKPDSNLDRLYISSFKHAGNGGDNCAISCDNSKLVSRLERPSEQDSPMIHCGLIASANQLIKDAQIRDKLSSEEDILCFEMEAAGLMNKFPCLVVRGICDYSDTHKDKIWQGYAAMAAAAFAKDVLRKLAPNIVAAERRLNEILSNLETQLSVITGSLRKSQRNFEVLHMDGHIERLTRWLGAVDVSSSFNRAIESRHKGSGQKVIEGQAYINWKENSKSFLWLNGIPGCGKTILASTIIEDLQADPECSRGLLYYYFDITDGRKQDFDGAIRSLSTQLYTKSSSARTALNSLYSSCKEGAEQPSISLLRSTFNSMVQQAGEVWIVIDALDECQSRVGLLRWLEDLRIDQMNTHVLVTSRNEHDIHFHMHQTHGEQDFVNVCDQLLEDDIRSYVQAHVREHNDSMIWQERPDIQEGIETNLIQKSRGMFLWVRYQLEALRKYRDPVSFQKALAALPRDLDETYKRTLANIPQEYMSQTIRILQFMVYSERPLRVVELVDAIAVNTEPSLPRGARFDPRDRLPVPAEITGYCPNFIVVQRELKDAASRLRDGCEEVYLTHFSVKEYLITEHLVSHTASSFKETSARGEMAEVCLAYLLELEPSHNVDDIREAFPLSEYSARYWASHASVGHSDNALRLAVELLMTPSLTEIWYQLYNPDDPDMREPNIQKAAPGLYYAALLGLTHCVSVMIEKGASVNARGGKYDNALQAASTHGHREIVRILLDEGADINAFGGIYGTSLQAAAANGHTEVVRILIQHGAEIQTRGKDGLTASEAAATGGHEKIAVMLLNHLEASNSTQENTTGSDADNEDLPSDTESIFSVFSDTSINTVLSSISDLGMDFQTILDETVSLMLEKSELYSGLKDAVELRNMQRDRLERNFVRLLRKMSRDLKKEELGVEQLIQQGTASFFKRYAPRMAFTICERVHLIVSAQDDSMEPSANKGSTSQPGNQGSFTHITVEYGKDLTEEPAHQGKNGLEYSDSDPEDDDPGPENHQSTTTEGLLQHIKAIVAKSQAFERLIQGLNDFVHPSFHDIAQRIIREEAMEKRSFELTEDMQTTLDDLVSELSYSAPVRLEESMSSQLSWADKTQLLAERLSNQEWLWWPLEAPQHPLKQGFAKLSWICKCGRHRSISIPQSLSKRLVKLVNSSSMGSGSHSVPGSSETSPKVNARSHVSGNSHPSSSRLAVNQNPNSSVPISTATTSQQDAVGVERYIFLMASADCLRLEELPSLRLGSEEFCVKLRQKYYELRGGWRSWVSLYAFSHCDFVEFEKYWTRRFAHRGHGLPAAGCKEYHFQAHRNPPISAEEFRDLFHFSPRRVEIRTLPFTRAISEVAPNVVERIPQRKFALRDPQDSFWGIFCREKISFAMFMGYVILSLSPSFAFCFAWLFGLGFTTDLQNATVPLMFSLSLFAIVLSCTVNLEGPSSGKMKAE